MSLAKIYVCWSQPICNLDDVLDLVLDEAVHLHDGDEYLENVSLFLCFLCKAIPPFSPNIQYFTIIYTLGTIGILKSVYLQGVQKKMRSSFCLVSLSANMLEGWDIIHWKGGIHSFVWSRKTFLYDIWEPRYKQIKMGYQISNCLNIGQS